MPGFCGLLNTVGMSLPKWSGSFHWGWLSAVFHSSIPIAFLAGLKSLPGLSPIFMMAAAFILNLCSEADTFIAGSFATLFLPAPLLAFMLVGPMPDVKFLVMYRTVFRPRLILWLAFLVTLVLKVDGKCSAAGYLNPRYFWGLYLCIFFLAAFLINTMIKIFLEQDYKGGVPVFLYLLIPLILFPVANRAQLGDDAVARRGVVFTEVSDDRDSHAQVPDIQVKNPDRTDRYSELLMNPELSVGKDVDLIGRTAFNSMLLEESFDIYRFIIFCYAADAMPSGFIVISADLTNIEEEQWSRVQGIVSITAVRRKRVFICERFKY